MDKVLKLKLKVRIAFNSFILANAQMEYRLKYLCYSLPSVELDERSGTAHE
jgi:hypothetical protein